ncbi:unnamed protein product [Polarella glacialis]|uniref:EF-hand domain-containing protein n=2 Tax=Polarella glacialis TaxID=89957 RepID=A0A813JBR9_POLGL|nr:unnamed protein product [Polarella glacialis]
MPPCLLQSKGRYVRPGLRRDLGMPLAANLTEPLKEAIAASGHKSSEFRIKRAFNRDQAQKYREEKLEPTAAMGSVQLDEIKLRRVFQKLDLDGGDVLNAKMLKHFFHQMGKTVDSNEIDGMIAMVDPKEQGFASYEDFAAIFTNPAEGLRQVNAEYVRDAVKGVDKNALWSGDSEDQDSHEDDYESDSD